MLPEFTRLPFGVNEYLEVITYPVYGHHCELLASFTQHTIEYLAEECDSAVIEEREQLH